MADKKNNASTEEAETNIPNELFQLRDILFGEDKREFEAHFSELEHKTNLQLEQLHASINQDLAEIRQSIDKSFALLSERLSDADHMHNEREDEIKQFAENTADKLEAFERHSQRTTKEVIEKIASESNLLSDSFNKQFREALEQLEQVSNTLQSNKADRKLLAELLTSAAKELGA